jgi:hypothetical protein
MASRHSNGAFSALAGISLVLIGVVFLAQQFFGDSLNFISWSFLWPLFVVVPGLAFFAAMLQGGKRSGAFAIPGSIITITGVLLFYQNATGHWQSWAYAWALIAPTGVGIGRIIQGRWSENPFANRGGRRLVAIGLTLFIVGAIFFELVLNISGFASGLVGQLVLPILLIATGAYLVMSKRPHKGTLV